MFVIIAVMLMVWVLLVLCRNPIRARWWTWRLATAADPEIRLVYFQRLVALGPTGAAAVEDLLRNDDAAIRGLGVAVVNHTKPERARTLLTTMLTDPDPEVATMAVTGLAMLGDAAVIEDLARLLESSDPHQAVNAVTGLGCLRTPAAIDLLIKTARAHTFVATRVQAIEELGQLQVQRATDMLSECLTDDTPFAGLTVSERSATALLARAAPGLSVEPPPLSRPVSHFAASALRAIANDNFTSPES